MIPFVYVGIEADANRLYEVRTSISEILKVEEISAPILKFIKKNFVAFSPRIQGFIPSGSKFGSLWLSLGGLSDLILYSTTPITSGK